MNYTHAETQTYVFGTVNAGTMCSPGGHVLGVAEDSESIAEDAVPVLGTAAMEEEGRAELRGR